jgi:O-antigen ligase
VRLLTPQYGAKYGLIRRKSPHSLPLKLGAETGLIGLSVFFWLTLTAALLSMGLWRERDGDHELGALLLAVGVCIGASNIFHTGFLLNHTLSAYFWLLYGTCARRYMVGDVEGEEDEGDEEVLAAA